MVSSHVFLAEMVATWECWRLSSQGLDISPSLNSSDSGFVDAALQSIGSCGSNGFQAFVNDGFVAQKVAGGGAVTAVFRWL